MATAENLRRKINDIRETLKISPLSVSDIQGLKEIGENIRSDWQNLNFQKETAYVAEILFKDNETSLLTILKSDLKKPEELPDFVNLCAEIFYLAVSGLDIHEIERYCVQIWNYGCRLCRNENLKGKRDAAFDLLAAMMDKLKLSPKRDTINVKYLRDWIMEQADMVNKLTGTVKKGVYQLMGALCKYYPEILVDKTKGRNYASTFAGLLSLELKNQMDSSTKAPVYTAIEGSFMGLSGLLCNFSDIFDTASARISMRQLYDYAKRAVSPLVEAKRHGPKKAALELLTTHATLFGQFFYEEYAMLYGYFRTLAVHSDRDLRYAGLSATEALIQQVSSELLNNVVGHRAEAETVYRFFVDSFLRELQRAKSTREVAIAAKGCGYFAAACKALYGSQRLGEVLAKLTGRCEEVFLMSSDPLEQKVTYISMFLEGFAMIFSAIDEVPSDVWLSMETLHILLFQHFPLLDSKYHQRSIAISYRLFFATLPFNERYVDTIIYQSIARLCSLAPPALVNADDETQETANNERDPRNLTYRSYLPLWNQLLNADSIKGWDNFGLDPAAKDIIGKNVSESLFKAIVEMLDRLDFSTVKRVSTLVEETDGAAEEETNPSSDPVTNKAAKKATDICLMINLADFTRDLLTTMNLPSFSEWIFPMSSRLMDLSTRFPLISGFYKMLTLCLNIGSKLNLLEAGNASVNAQNSFELFSRYIDEVSIKMKQFKDDLFVSCLELILAIPSDMVVAKLAVLADVIKSSLKLGLSYLPLAEACLSALERWNADEACASNLKPLYSSVLPTFDEYLRSEGVEENSNGTSAASASKANRKRTAARKEIMKQKARSKAMATRKSVDVTRLNDLRVRILLFVGKLGGEVNKYLIEQTAEEIAKKCVIWDTDTRLEFSIPFLDMKPTIKFDGFLPRICELAVWCGNRQTKIAACELLHSIVLLLLGKAAAKRDVLPTDGSSEQRNPFHKLYRKLFPVLLQLCCDADEVPKQLFRTLMSQSIHWFTSNKSSNNPETTALLDALMDGVVDENANLRDYCAECLNEFLKWSIKHSSRDSTNVNQNFRSLWKRLQSLASHPAGNKRLGAALAFNSIYRTFREEETFVDMYTFEIFAVYMNSLARAHGDVEGEDGGTIDQLNDITKHIDRIVRVKKALLNKASQIRRIPVGWKAATLADCIEWLFEQVGRPQSRFRQRCFELLISWIPLVDGQSVFHDYVSKYVKKRGLPSLFHLFENGGVIGDASGGIRKLSKIDSNDCTFQTLRDWFDSLEAALDCYLACFDQGIISAKDLFDDRGTDDVSILASLQCFVDETVWSDRFASIAYTPQERRSINRAKCNVMIRTFAFMEVLFKAKVTTFPFLKKFWRLLIRCCFCPSSLGFDLTIKETALYLPKTLDRVLVSIKSLPRNVADAFFDLVKASCESDFAFPSITTLLDDRNTNWISLNEVLRGYEICIQAAVLPDGLFPSGESLWQKIADISFVAQSDGNQALRSWPPSALLAAKNILSTAARITKEMKTVVAILVDSTPIFAFKGATRMSEKGRLFLNMFWTQVGELAARHPHEFLSTMTRRDFRLDEVKLGENLVKVTDSIMRNRELRSEFGDEYVKQVSLICRRNFEDLANGDEKSKLLCVGLLQKLLLIDTMFLSSSGAYLFDLYVNFLGSKTGDLRFKNKVLMLLGPFAICGTDQNEKLKNALDSFIVYKFPFQSSEFEKGTRDYDEYLTALRRMTFGLSVSNNTVILEALITVLSREKEHCAEAELAALLATYCRQLPSSKYESIIVVPLDFFMSDDRQISDDHRLNCLGKFLLPMLNGFDDNMLSRFFLDKGLKRIMEKVETPVDKSNEFTYKNQLTVKLGCFRMLELMYNRLSLAILKGQINTKYANGRSEATPGTMLIRTLVSTAGEARKEGKNDLALIDLKRSYRCAAQNLLIAVISKTQTKPNLFEKLIFEGLWDSVIDESRTYAFEIELEKFLERKHQSVNSQPSWRIGGRRGDQGGSQRPMSLHFLIQSMLSDSSIRSETSQYDFNESSQPYEVSLSQIESSQDDQARPLRRDQDSQSQSLTASTSVSESGNGEGVGTNKDLEADELNLHPCMEPILNAIRTLVERNLAPTELGVMPNWMQLLWSSMSSYGTSINVRLFIARIITILDEIFKPYAKHWVAPLIKLCLDTGFINLGLNYFRVDIITTLLQWSKDSEAARNADGRLKSELFQYCMTHAPSESSQIFRRNLRLLNLMLELWKDFIIIDPRIITEHLQYKFVDEPAKINVGVQCLGVILANGLNPLGREEHATTDLYRNFGCCLAAKSAKTYKPAAEVIGLALKYLTQQGSDNASEVEENMEAQMRNLLMQDRAKFLSCLHAIQRHHPTFSDRFLRDVIARLTSVHGEFKAYSLEILCARSDRIENLYSELKARGFITFLSSSDERNQVWSVRILSAIVDKMTLNELNEAISILSTMLSHSSAECRRALAEFFIQVYDKRRNTAQNGETDEDAVGSLARDALLVLLNDAEPGLRSLIYNFWSHETRLSSNTTRRLLNILEQTYSNATESEFLGHATYLLLELTSRSPDYKRPIFDTPLQECRFEDLRVATSWKHRYASLQMPAFAESVIMSQQQHQSPTRAGTLGVRATAAAGPNQFSATMAHSGADSTAYDWVSGASFDTYADTTFGQSMDTDESGLLFAARSRHRRPVAPGQPNGGARRRIFAPEGAGSAPELDDEDELRRLRRRIIKDNRHTTSAFFARMQTRRNQAKEKLEEERKKAREQNVQLYRTYRQGDFPDVQISHSAMIAPLQALAQQDPIVASLLLASLIDGVYHEVINGDQEQATAITSEMVKSIQNIIETSTTHYKPLLASLQIFCYHRVKKFKIDPEIVCNASLLAHQERMAIVLLEKSILHGNDGDDGEKEPKRRRRHGARSAESEHDAMSDDAVAQWANLAKLYKSLNDHDSVRATYGNKLTPKSITKDALAAESSGEYQQAVALYTKALRDYSKDEDEMSVLDSAEFSMWEESRLECLDSLNKWTDLATVATKYIDDEEPPNLNKVWDDPYALAEYFPSLLRSKLKLLASAEDRNGTFLPYMDEWRNDGEKRRWFENHHPESLTLFTIVKRDYGDAGHLCTKALKKFLKDWTSLSVTDHFARQQCLQSLQPLVEMHDFIDLEQKGKLTSLIGLDREMKRLERQIPGVSSDCTSTWNDVITNRGLFAEQLCQDLIKRKVDEQDAYHCVFGSELRMNLRAVSNALHMRNYAVAFSILESSKEHLVKVLKDDKTSLEWAHCYAQAQHVVASRSTSLPADASSRLLSTISLLDRFRDSAASSELRADHALLEGISLEKIGWLCVESTKGHNTWTSKLDANSRRSLEMLGFDDNDPQSAFEILHKAFPLYSQAVKEELNDVVDYRSLRVDSRLTLAEYCDRILREDLPQSKAIESYPRILVENLLTSMKNGSARARLLFPRLIEIIEQYPDVGKTFVTEAAKVPPWMFLSWLSQITAVLNKPFAQCFHGIVERIADEYPEALVYCFKISSEGYIFGHSSVDKKNQKFVEKIAKKMEAVAGVKEFIRALMLFSLPTAILKDLQAELNHLYSSKTTAEERKKRLVEFYDEIFKLDYSDDELGNFWKEFRTKFQSVFDSALGQRCETLLSKNATYTEVKNKLDGLLTKGVAEICKADKLPSSLDSYSHWLSQFDAQRLGLHLEIPGQYNGDELPRLEGHVRISGFDPDVRALSSIRVPRKLTIRGDDGKEYALMVKTGEDLRQDERIQRLFGQMNQVFSADSECRRMNVHIRTYSVTPLSSRLGLIEWVPNAKTLKEFTNIDPMACAAAIRCIIGPDKQPIKVNDNDPSAVWRKQYERSFHAVPHAKMVECFENAERHIPKFNTRDAIERLCASPEGFYTLRSQFTSSYATMCISNYVLGVGDRHTSNIMIDETSATAVGIDFGHAFGSAIGIAVPELMPFRLTQQIRSVFEPIGIHGQAKGTMVTCLRALRENRYALLNTMNIFVTEPSIDWLQQAKRNVLKLEESGGANSSANNSGNSGAAEGSVTSSGTLENYAPKRLEAARRKLNGDNPASIMEAELKNVLEYGYSRERAIEVIFGKRTKPVSETDREQPRGYSATGLNAEDQVRCLIDMAVDPLIVARAWAGWTPWM